MTKIIMSGEGEMRFHCVLDNGRIGRGSNAREAYESAQAEIVLVNAPQTYDDLTAGITWTEDDICAVAETLEVESKNGVPCPLIMNSEIFKRIQHDIEFICPANLKGVETIILNVYTNYVAERSL